METKDYEKIIEILEGKVNWYDEQYYEALEINMTLADEYYNSYLAYRYCLDLLLYNKDINIEHAIWSK